MLQVRADVVFLPSLSVLYLWLLQTQIEGCDQQQGPLPIQHSEPEF